MTRNAKPEVKNPPRKRGRPAIGAGTTIGVRLRPEELKAFDRLVVEQSPKTTRAGLVAAIIAAELIHLGYLPEPD